MRQDRQQHRAGPSYAAYGPCSMPSFINIAGTRYGYLIALGLAPKTGGRTPWRCRCDCGNIKDVLSYYLRAGLVKSCGCKSVEMQVAKITRHGNTCGGLQTPEYRAWADIKDRVFNPRSQGYLYYGGRGIGMYQPWADSFDAFLADVGQRPRNKTSIGRIKVNEGYFPGNVRWEDALQQGASMRKNVYLNLNGQRVHLRQAARLMGVSKHFARKLLPLWDQKTQTS